MSGWNNKNKDCSTVKTCTTASDVPELVITNNNKVYDVSLWESLVNMREVSVSEDEEPATEGEKVWLDSLDLVYNNKNNNHKHNKRKAEATENVSQEETGWMIQKSKRIKLNGSIEEVLEVDKVESLDASGNKEVKEFLSGKGNLSLEYGEEFVLLEKTEDINAKTMEKIKRFLADEDVRCAFHGKELFVQSNSLLNAE